MKIRCNKLLHTHGQKKLTLQCASQSVAQQVNLSCASNVYWTVHHCNS